MSHLQYLSDRKSTPGVVFHRFRVSRRTPGSFHVFVEAQDDILFYATHFQSRIAVADYHDCDGKGNVIAVAGSVLSYTGRISECLFLMDRDYDWLFPHSLVLPEIDNIVVTSGYSVESYFDVEEIFEHIVCRRHGRDENCQNYRIVLGELRRLRDEFTEAFRRVAASMAVARVMGVKIDLDKFDIKDLLILHPDRIKLREDYLRRIEKFWPTVTQFDTCQRDMYTLLLRHPYSRWIRGKQWLDFLRWLACEVITPALIKRIRPRGRARSVAGHPPLGPREFLEAYAPRIECPEHLAEAVSALALRDTR